MQNSVGFLYTNNIQKNILIHLQRYLGVNLTNKIKDLHTENFNTLMKDIKDKNKWEEIQCSWIRRINVIEISILARST
jgi:hypothetical protein